jgi:hypothetical protein
MAVIINFDEAPAGGPGGPLTPLMFQYAELGVVFNRCSLIDYASGPIPVPGFARSGTRAIEQCVGREFCEIPIEATFTAAQPRVKVWVGCSLPLHQPRTAALIGYDNTDQEIDRDTYQFPQSPVIRPINIPLEVSAANAVITRIAIGFLDGYTNGLAVDDLEFDIPGSPPGCPTNESPLVSLTEPVIGSIYQRNEFRLAGTLFTEAPVESATLVAATAADRHSMDLSAGDVFPLEPPGGRFGPVSINEFLLPGQNLLTLSVTTCAGTEDASSALAYNPIPQGVRFQVLAIDVDQPPLYEPDGILLSSRYTLVRVFLHVIGANVEIGRVTGFLTGRRHRPRTAWELDNPLEPTRLPSLNAAIINPADDLEAKRSDINASVNFALPRDWTTPGQLHLSFRIEVDGRDSPIPCDGCEDLDELGHPRFVWFRDSWPILETQYDNPYVNHPPGSDWTGDIVDRRTQSDPVPGIIASAAFDTSEPTPRFEWMQILAPEEEYDRQLVAASGTAVTPKDSDDDIWFTHPFGFDTEFFVALDPKSWPLLAPPLRVEDEEIRQAALTAYDRGLQPFDLPVLVVETDMGLLPPNYRPRDGDRVAVFGRWIVDSGHNDFHTEIHPPLLIASASREREGIGQVTRSRVISRPYLVGQDFGDGTTYKHLVREVMKAGGLLGFTSDWGWFGRLLNPLGGLFGFGGIPSSTRLEAHPTVYAKPFVGDQVMSYIVRPPSPRRGVDDRGRVHVAYHFTTRTGVYVNVHELAPDSVEVVIRMSEREYIPPPLSQCHDWVITEAELDRSASEITLAFKIFFLTVLQNFGWAQAAWFSVVLSRGILTDRYDDPVPSSPTDSANVVRSLLERLPSPTPASVDNDQPFPIYGWIDVWWEEDGRPSSQNR